MNKKIDWLNHGLEFLVVLIGILIAFQLNKFSEDSAKRKLLDNHLTYISEESQDNQKELQNSILHSEEQLERADSLLMLIQNRGDLLTINQLALKLLNLNQVGIRTNAYQVLTQSGDIRFINNFKKKKEIINLYEAYAPVKSVDKNTQRIYDSYFYPYLKDNFNLANWNGGDQLIANKEKYYADEFGNIVSTYRYLLSRKIKSYQKCSKRLQEFMDASKK